MRINFTSLLVLSLLTFNSFAQNTWQTKATFLGGKRAGSNVFAIGNFGFVFGGTDSSLNYRNDLWLYDPLANQWTQRASLPGPGRNSAVECVTGNKVFLGTGFDGISYYNDWWEYNSSANSWTQKANFPGAVRSTANSLTINDNGYVGLGKGATWYDDWYQYNFGNDSWTQKTDFPGGTRQNCISFGIGNYGYVGCGSVNNSYSVNDMFRYDPQSDSWIARTDYPGIAGIYAPGYFVIDDKAFVCGGYNYITLRDDCYEYDVTNDTWTPIASFNNVSPPRYFRGGFAIAGKGYLTGGSIDDSFTTSGYRSDLIEHTSNYVGINDIEKNNITVFYSNSSQELILTALKLKNNSTIDVYNNAGQLVCQLKSGNELFQKWQLPLIPGIYYYMFNSTTKQIKTGSFVVINR